MGQSRCGRCSTYFNPRTPAKECDAIYCGITTRQGAFQSTHPREGVRQSTVSIPVVSLPISIHAPPRRSATTGRCKPSFPYEISIHAPPRRSATSSRQTASRDHRYFNPRTPAKECDLISFLSCVVVLIFQSTHPREGVRLVSFDVAGLV